MSLFFSKKFFPLFSCQFLGAVCDNIFYFTLVALIDIKLMPLVFAISSAPPFIFAIFAGQVSDKISKSRLIVYIKAFEILIMTTAFFAFYYNQIYLLIFLLFLMKVQSSFFGPVKYSIIPNLLKDKELIKGNTLIEYSTVLAIISGIIIATFLEKNIALAILLTSTFLGFIVSNIIPKQTPVHPTLKLNYNFLKTNYTIVKESCKPAGITTAIIGISYFWMIGGVLAVQVPQIVKGYLMDNKIVLGLLFIMVAIGFTLGSIACVLYLKEKIKTYYVFIVLIVLGLAFADLGYLLLNEPSFASLENISTKILLNNFDFLHMCFDLIVITFCAGIYVVPMYAILQRQSDIKFRSRTIASNDVINAFTMVAIGLLMNFTAKYTIFIYFFILNFIFIYYFYKQRNLKQQLSCE